MQAGAPGLENNPFLQEPSFHLLSKWLTRTTCRLLWHTDQDSTFHFTLPWVTLTLSKLRLFIPKDFGTVIIILHGVLHKAEAVHITNKGVAVGPQEVKPTHSLLQEEAEDMGLRHTGRKQWGTAVTLPAGNTQSQPTLPCWCYSHPPLHAHLTSLEQVWRHAISQTFTPYCWTKGPNYQPPDEATRANPRLPRGLKTWNRAAPGYPALLLKSSDFEPDWQAQTRSAASKDTITKWKRLQSRKETKSASAQLHGVPVAVEQEQGVQFFFHWHCWTCHGTIPRLLITLPNCKIKHQFAPEPYLKTQELKKTKPDKQKA